MSNLIIKEVTFNNVVLIGVQKDEKIFVSIKKICDDLGVDFSGQLKKIKTHSILNKRCGVISIPSNGGIQEAFCIEHKYLTSWLMGISPNKCKKEIQPLLEDFQEKAADVLFNAFLVKKANPESDSPKTYAEMFMMSAQEMIENEKKLNELNDKIIDTKDKLETLIQERNDSQEQLTIFEAPAIIPLQKTERSKLVQLVRTYCYASNIPARAAWHHLYKEFLYIYHIDIIQCAKNRNIKNLEYVEKILKVDDLYALAYKLFVPKKNSTSPSI